MTNEERIAYIKEWLKDEYSLNPKDREVLTAAINALEELPKRRKEVKRWKAKALEQQKIGEWIWCVGSHKCSCCEEYTCFSHRDLLRYCPNCGARMVEPQESEVKQ